MEGTDPLLAEIQRNLDQDVDLAHLAERFGYSPFHFHRVFTRTLGETPRSHVERLRLEKALLLVVVTDATILDIALTVGFQNHETFTRAFKRLFGATPSEIRTTSRRAERRPPDNPDRDYSLSEVRYLSLPSRHMAAVRHIGPYSEPLVPPFTAGDPYWTGLAAWAEGKGIGHDRLPWGFFLDMPGITPDAAMRADFCIEVDRAIEPDGPYFPYRFAGGLCGAITHEGPFPTLPQAYRALVNAILARPDKVVLTGAPPFQIHRQIHVGGDESANLTEVYFPVVRVR